MLAAAKTLKDKGIMQYPYVTNSKSGWNLGEEFVNMYLGMGGDFFKEGTAEPAIDGEKGVKALTMLKDLVAYSNPDFLTYDSNATQALWEGGNAAISMMWGSRAGAVLDADGSTPEVIDATVLAAAPTVGGGSIPATSLWWDGFVIAKNASDTDAEASFQAMMAGMAPDVIKANNGAAVWLANGYTPTPAAAGVFASAKGGARPYPTVPYMGLMQTALGDNLSDFMQGSETAEQALKDASAAYTTAAKGQGFIK